jgi:hypothetical protein
VRAASMFSSFLILGIKRSARWVRHLTCLSACCLSRFSCERCCSAAVDLRRGKREIIRLKNGDGDDREEKEGCFASLICSLDFSCSLHSGD